MFRRGGLRREAGDAGENIPCQFAFQTLHKCRSARLFQGAPASEEVKADALAASPRPGLLENTQHNDMQMLTHARALLGTTYTADSIKKNVRKNIRQKLKVRHSNMQRASDSVAQSL
ncbi:hypothetical protein EYF80_001165 [Liparis tanakae]|uniref:Uncharacterized protein n=1 Tax=Liparis tanakae TaxID=230148 RepID=A0A4Z2JF30_9TELE|nr:hypothetical protein EYF80_001165 [Liparis tanakae]